MAAPRVTKKKKNQNQNQTKPKPSSDFFSTRKIQKYVVKMVSLTSSSLDSYLLFSFFPPRLSFVSPPPLLLLLLTMTIKQARRRDQGLIDDSRRHRVV